MEGSQAPRASDSADAGGRAKHRWPSAVWVLVVLAVGVRVGLLSHVAGEHPDYLVQDLEAIATGFEANEGPYIDDFGYEASNIAYAWACGGQGFASPFGGVTGPTAWIAPGIVAIYAASFMLFGCFTPASILFAYGLALIASAVTAICVFLIGRLLARDPAVGLLAAFFFAVLPYEAWTFHTTSQLDFNFQVLWFGLLLLAVLRSIDEPQQRGVWLGVTAALAALFNPVFLLCTAVGVGLALLVRPSTQRWRFVATVGATTAAILAPYVMWQSFRLHTFVPIKSNASVELLIGNTPVASGLLRHQVFLTQHPSQNREQFEIYRDIGETAYVRLKRSEFLEKFDPEAFLNNTVSRAYQFFVNYRVKSWDHSELKVALKRTMWAIFFLSLVVLVAVRLGRPSRLETAALLVTLAYSLPYLFTGIMERYRIPITPMVVSALALLAAEAWRVVGNRALPRRSR